MKEQWKPFAGGNYAVSNLGRVMRLTLGRNTWPGRMLRTHVMTMGYTSVSPVINGKNVPCYVHSLVADAFIGTRPEGHEVNHKDGNKANNDWRNLEYVTHQGNMRHARANRMIKDRCTISVTMVQQIRDLRACGMSYGKIVAETGVSIGHCWAIANNRKRKDI